MSGYNRYKTNLEGRTQFGMTLVLGWVSAFGSTTGSALMLIPGLILRLISFLVGAMYSIYSCGRVGIQCVHILLLSITI